jgi:hypothetical protein
MSIFDKHRGDALTAMDKKMLALAITSARSDGEGATGETYVRHVEIISEVRKAAGQSPADAAHWATAADGRPTAAAVVTAATVMFQTKPQSAEDEGNRWETLLQVMGDTDTMRVKLPLSGAGSTVDVHFLDALLAMSYTSGGKTYPHALCTAMLVHGAAFAQVTEDTTIPFIGVMDAAADFFSKIGGGDTNRDNAARLYMIAAEALHATGRTREAAETVVGVIQLTPDHAYPWAVLCELLQEQEPGTFVNVKGHRITAEGAYTALQAVLARQRVGGTVPWPVVGVVAVGLVAVGLFFVRWRRNRSQ